MAWTVPMTFTAGTALTAAQLNTHLRDNLLETATSKATTVSQYFVATGFYSIAARKAVANHVNVAETTTSTEYTSLATPGPSVTCETGNRAIIWISAETSNTSAAASRVVSYQISGDTTRDPLDSNSLRQDGNAAANHWGFGTADLVTTLTPGTNTFSLRYKTGSGTATFDRRRIVVWPL